MSTPEIVNLIGRLGVAFYFLWAVAFNFRAWDHHVAEFKRIGISQGGPALVLGLLVKTAGSLLLLYPPTVVIGGALLIAFTVGADALFHRFWTYADPGEQVMHKFFLYEHVALIGGLLGLMAGPH